LKDINFNFGRGTKSTPLAPWLYEAKGREGGTNKVRVRREK